MVGVYVYHKKRKDEIVRNNMREEPVFSAPPDIMREEPVFATPPDNMREEPVFPDQNLSNFAPQKYEDQESVTNSVRAYGEENVPSYEDAMGNGVGDGGGGYDGGGDGSGSGVTLLCAAPLLIEICRPYFGAPRPLQLFTAH